ncbi:MAG: ATP-binding protein [Desulfotignum sp.]
MSLKSDGYTTCTAALGQTLSGLGLLVTKKLVEEHRGTIDIATRLGYGSVFTVTLPERPETARDQTDK